MPLPQLEGLLQRLLRHAAEGHGLLLTCLALAFAGTTTAAYPVTAVVVPAALLAARRWRAVAVASAFGSALGATALVLVFHHLGWRQVYAHFPEMATHPAWAHVTAWTSSYGIVSLFVIAATPLPQTPALIFFGVVQPQYAGIFAAMLLGKLLKYGFFAWAASHFPDRFSGGLAGFFRRRRPRR